MVSKIDKDNKSVSIILNKNQMIKAENGNYYLIIKISKEMFYSLLEESKTRKHSDINLLTDREIEVLKLVAKGKKNAKIAKELSISTHTVKAHIANILAKLSAEDRTQAVITGILAKIIDI